MLTALLSWYSVHGRPLPWREDGTSVWAILLCEVMSQQTPVARIIEPWRSWLEEWPTPADVAAAPAADVIRAWGTLGYPRRALRLRECAQVITERHGGRVPDTYEELLALPGIGPYTAGAVLAFGHGKRAQVLDTNVARVSARLHGEALPSPSLTKAERERAARLIPEDTADSVIFNAAIMEVGALVCTAVNPTCEKCPVADWCEWRRAGYPADKYASRRKVQPFEGTLRQARGQVLAVLRSSSEPVNRAALADIPQWEKALSTLVSDSLVEVDGTRVGLPGSLGA